MAAENAKLKLKAKNDEIDEKNEIIARLELQVQQSKDGCPKNEPKD